MKTEHTKTLSVATDANEKHAQVLAHHLIHGVSAMEELNTAGRQIQASMVANLVNGVQEQQKLLNQITETKQKVFQRYIMQLDIEADSMTAKELGDAFDKLQKSETDVLEFQRKFLQGKELSAMIQPMSEEARNVMMLLNSFKTEEDKRKFLMLLENFSGDAPLANSGYFQDVEEENFLLPATTAIDNDPTTWDDL